MAFIGIRLYMGIHKYPSIESYWNNSNLYTNIISSIMPKSYYFLLAKCLHFPEKEENEINSDLPDDNDPRGKINFFLEKLSLNFRKYYILGKNITIDESLLHFTGRNKMKFYIPMKPHKWGFKMHLLCDSDTHYLYNILFDPGKDGKKFIYFEENTSLSESIVLKLLSCVNDNKQRHIFFDGWYSSINLIKKLTEMGYMNTTILRSNAKDLPSKIKLEGYDNAYKDKILLQKYEDKKKIFFATNYKIDKEDLKNTYNIKNRGVDVFDQYLENSSIQRKTKKWYKKVFLFGIDAAIINSKIICELKEKRIYSTVLFKEKIIETIFEIYKKYNSKNDNFKTTNNKSYIPNRFRLILHNIGHIVNEKKRCKYCSKKTPYICKECNLHLHPECFTIYHNNNVYNKTNY